MRPPVRPSDPPHGLPKLDGVTPPLADEFPGEEGSWRPLLRIYDRPPRTPQTLTRVERRDAIRYWQARGLLGPDGRPTRRWQTTLGALFE